KDTRVVAVRTARAAVADAGLGAAAGQLPALQVDVRLPHRGAAGRPDHRAADRRPVHATVLDRGRRVLPALRVAFRDQALLGGGWLRLQQLVAASAGSATC